MPERTVKSGSGPSQHFAAPHDFGRKRGIGKSTVSHLSPRATLVTRMYGPAVRRKRSSSNWREGSCINVSGLCLERIVLRATMDISAPATSLADRPQRAIWVTSARRRREDRSSISSHPLADLGGVRWSAMPLSSGSWRSMRRRIKRSSERAGSLRSPGPAPERSRRCVRAYWPERWPAHCGGDASWPPRARI
jgi:hypothetical protein